MARNGVPARSRACACPTVAKILSKAEKTCRGTNVGDRRVGIRSPYEMTPDRQARGDAESGRAAGGALRDRSMGRNGLVPAHAAKVGDRWLMPRKRKRRLKAKPKPIGLGVTASD